MIVIMIYDNGSKNIKNEIRSINRALNSDSFNYEIHVFNSIEDKLIKNNNVDKIYILNIFQDVDIVIAKRLRKLEPSSNIIVLANCDKYQSKIFENKLMVLDFICDKKDYLKRLTDDICYIIDKIYAKECFTFKYNHVVYKLSYSEINYIEKESAIKRCIIHAINGDYFVVSSISCLDNKLAKNFFRSHQSCIVNMSNIVEFDLVNNIITFKNGDMTSLISDKMKKQLVKTLGFRE